MRGRNERNILGTRRQNSRKRSPCCLDRKSTRLNSSHSQISYAVFCLKKKKTPRWEIFSTLPTTLSRYRPDTYYACWSCTSMAILHISDALAFVAASHAHCAASETELQLDYDVRLS